MNSISYPAFSAFENIASKFASSSIVSRAFVLKAIERLESCKDLQTPFVFDGPSGIGKTFALAQILEHYQARGDHFIVKVESGTEWVCGKYAYQRRGDKWEQPFLATLFLKKLTELNQELADKFRTNDHLILGAKEFQKGTPYSELLNFGATNIDYGTETVEALFKEFQAERKVLITVDKLNAFYSVSCYFDPDSQPIHSSNFLLPRAVLSVFNTPSLAKVVGATTRSSPNFRDGVKGVELLFVPPLTKAETKEFLDMLKRNMVTFGENNVDKLKLLSGGNPRKLYNICRNPLEL